MNEIWEQVVDSDGWYEVSSLGNVRSYKGLGTYPKRLQVPKAIKPCVDGRGYLNFTASKNGKNKVRLIHREVAKAFIPNPNGYKLVRHLNDIKSDNNTANLAWGTHKDNRMDGIVNGKHFHEKGVRPAQAKLNSAQVIKILESIENNCQIAKMYNVTEGTISKIKLGRTWNKVTGLPLVKSDYRQRATSKRRKSPTKFNPKTK